MDKQSVRIKLLIELSKHYEHDLREFVVLPQPMMQMSTTRATLAELRNDGYVEERTRGVVRLRPLGYMMYQKQRLSNGH